MSNDRPLGDGAGDVPAARDPLAAERDAVGAAARRRAALLAGPADPGRGCRVADGRAEALPFDGRRPFALDRLPLCRLAISYTHHVHLNPDFHYSVSNRYCMAVK
jgi:hypothetical protein